jgi:hypothetical protein
MENMFGTNVVVKDPVTGKESLNPEFKGELAERYWYSYQLDKSTLETQYQTEKIKAEATFNATLLNTLLGTKDMDYLKGTAIYTTLAGIPGLREFLGVNAPDYNISEIDDPRL